MENVNAYPDLARRGRRASRDDASSASTLPSPTASSLQDRPRMKSSTAWYICDDDYDDFDTFCARKREVLRARVLIEYDFSK